MQAIGASTGTTSGLPQRDHRRFDRLRVDVAAQAGAVRSAPAVDGFAAELVGGRPQLAGERRQLGHLSLGVAQLGGDQVMKAALHRAATLTIPDVRQICDLLQRAAELLGAGDERQPGEGGVVVQAVAARGAIRRVDKPDVFVEAQRRGAEPAAPGRFADRVGAHPTTVKVQPEMKVKR